MDTIDLLWRKEAPQLRRGRPPKYTTDQIVSTAITVADEKGAEFTVRDVAAAVGIPVMSLYSYVDGREQLIALMVDQVYLDMAYTDITSIGPGDDWQTMLSAVVADNLALFAEHPWLTDLAVIHAVAGPGALAKYERELTAVESLPFSDIAKDAVLTLALDFARTRSHTAATTAYEHAAQLPEKLAELGAAERFPIAARMVTAQAGKAPAHEVGFDVILTGIATVNAAITHHHGPAGDSGNRGRLTMRTPKSGPFAG
ncbi:TetR/AcrR family transcriptional regulator [Gordonia sp. (in: high G+C Gram-positive bacteria)]|uniref:TetR/AcrR family transcriptional regulator n=1 Tax=Gordonia sp. (in: high G+C Gram-positive bacteria) TaxID=84139 RepID=UPI002C4C3C99|nr:TetR/AcrR family transcriptional regulator C-terminal domain-containing protein [Gordonia sp. (in: high G+C Gram-positive bacteria)]HMS74963.1 TetR/AcrR family transcriptional regulator C-terminal domain-containing protein [Gordonia sp. (in: high G+C Gram-positive bacteria)]